MPIKTNILRKLSPSEEIFVKWNVSILAISQIQGVLTPTLLNKAMRVLSYRHPLLTAKVIKNLNSYYFQTTDRPIQIEVAHCNNRQEGLIYHQNYTHQELDISRGLIRIILIYYEPSFSKNDNILDIVTITSHAISDGISCVNLHKEILNTCNAITLKLDLNSKPLQVTPPIESFIARELATVNKNEVMGKFKHTISCKNVKIPPHQNNHNEANNIMVLSHLSIDEKLVKSIRNSCRKYKVAMIGALYAALLIYLYDQLNCKDNEYFLCRTSVNLRGLIKETINNDNLLTAATGHFINVKLTNKRKFWEIAKKISEEIEKRKKDKFILKEHLFYADLLNLTANIPIAFSVSNVGIIDISTQFKKFKLISFSLAVGCYNSQHIELIFSMFNRKMLCTIQYNANKFPEEFIKLLKINFSKILAHYSS